jgi:hypothetical protein
VQVRRMPRGIFVLLKKQTKAFSSAQKSSANLPNSESVLSASRLSHCKNNENPCRLVWHGT